MSTTFSDDAKENILAHIQEMDRLKKLSDLDLIRECMKNDAADEPVVEELMNRVRPGWLDEL